jgi:hypothetical protein
MISVENFYWALYKNLLEHSKINPVWYEPFGTFDTLRNYPFKKNPSQFFDSRQDFHHVFFYFDQEPIYDQNFGEQYEMVLPRWSNKYIKILANSESSILKKQICQQRDYLDWYYFFHGFAALDWFRDAQYVTGDRTFEKVFVCFNHLVRSRRAYRLSLVAKLVSYGLDKFGKISLFATPQDIMDECNNQHSCLTDHEKNIINTNLIGKVPLTIDSESVDGAYSAHFGHQELEIWQSFLWHVVTETVFYEPKQHLTEKIFKPIVSMRPFILVSAPGNLAYLRSYGFKTFDHWIDESYDNEIDHERRLDMIVNELGKLCSLPSSQLHQMHQEMLPILDYNKKHLFGNFRIQIVNELVDNWDKCLRIWMNGRIDDRLINLHPDIDAVKKILLR